MYLYFLPSEFFFSSADRRPADHQRMPGHFECELLQTIDIDQGSQEVLFVARVKLAEVANSALAPTPVPTTPP